MADLSRRFGLLASLLVLSSVRVGAEEKDEEDVYVYKDSWAVIQFITAFFPSTVALCALFYLTAIVSRVEWNGFNVYLMFIIFPDLLLNATIAYSFFWEGTHTGVYTMALCKGRNSVSFFYYFTNLYLNAVVVREIHVLVCNSFQRKRTAPPRLSKVLAQVAAVYTFTGLITTWMLLDVRWSPFAITDMKYCVTDSGSPTDDPVFGLWTANLVGSALVFPPFGYVSWVAYSIWKQKLLPIKGRTRAIAMYFSRIVLVFFGFYLPGLVLAFIYMSIPLRFPTPRFWILWVFGLSIPGQCLLTLRLLLSKDDIRQAVVQQRALLCRVLVRNEGATQNGDESNEWDADDVYDPAKHQSTWLEASDDKMLDPEVWAASADTVSRIVANMEELPEQPKEDA